MSAAPPRPDPAPFADTSAATDGKALVLTFWLMLAAALWSWSLSWNAPILDRHEFRQLQTAVSAHWLKQDGFRLDYETPLFGPPSWSIPMEFPVYQWCVARFSRLTGVALDQSARAVSVLFILATLPAVCGLAGLAGLARPGRLLVAAAVLSSPVYLFYGRTFMIESTALCLATWFLLAIGLSVRDLSLRWSAAATILGSLAALAKITTFAVYCFPAAGVALWFGWPCWKTRKKSLAPVVRALLLCAIPVLVAVVIGERWVQHADAVKDANPFSGFLKSTEMTAWNWGTLDQRLSLAVWNEVWNNIRQFVLSEPSFAVLLVCGALVATRIRWLAVAGAGAFLVGPLLFANLYFRHDYYYSANALLLLIASGFLLAGMWQSASLPRAPKVVMIALFFAAQLIAFYRGYGFNHRRALPAPPDIATIIRETVPPDGVVVIYGWDWESLVPYYAQRRAIMVPAGREDEMKVLDDILGQLPPRRVAALLIKQRVPTPFSPDFIKQRLTRFGLVTAPFATSPDGDLYLTAEELAPAAATLAGRTFARATVNSVSTAETNPDQLQEANLARLDLALMSPRPTRARSKFELKVGETGGRPVLFAHPISELFFTPAAGATAIEATFGIVDAAFDPNAAAVTDGVGFEIYEIRADGLRRDVYRRDLNPAQVPADRGPQTIHLTALGPFTGQLVFRTNPGPNNNLVNDWAYWGSIRLR